MFYCFSPSNRKSKREGSRPPRALLFLYRVYSPGSRGELTGVYKLVRTHGLPIFCPFTCVIHWPSFFRRSQIMMWIDILTLQQARRYPPVSMEPPAPMKVCTRLYRGGFRKKEACYERWGLLSLFKLTKYLSLAGNTCYEYMVEVHRFFFLRVIT